MEVAMLRYFAFFSVFLIVISSCSCMYQKPAAASTLTPSVQISDVKTNLAITNHENSDVSNGIPSAVSDTTTDRVSELIQTETTPASDSINVPAERTPTEGDEQDLFGFICSWKYPILQDQVFTFFKAYIQGDIETARQLMITPTPDCISYFSTEKGTLDHVTNYAVELISHADEVEGVRPETAHLDIRYGLEGNESIIYMCIEFELCETVGHDGIASNVWLIRNYDFDG